MSMMTRAQEQGYATQAEWNAAIERERIEILVSSGAKSVAPTIACKDMVTNLQQHTVAVYDVLGSGAFPILAGHYNVLHREENNIYNTMTNLPKEAQEEFEKLWRAEHQSLTAGFWDLDGTSKITAYKSQCSLRVQMICTGNNALPQPEGVLQVECERAEIR